MGIKTKHYTFLLLTLFSLIFQGCLPQTGEVDTVSNAGSNQSTDNSDNSTDEENELAPKVLPEPVNFLQLNTTKSSTSINLFADYQDSFLIRGNNLITYLFEELKTNQPKYCLIAHFPNIDEAGASEVLVMSAKIRTYYSIAQGSKEYYLQVEPNNKTINQSDCISLGLNTAISNFLSTTSIVYKLEDLCPTCDINVQSSGMNLFTNTGSLESDILVSQLSLNIIPELGSTSGSTTGQTCTVSSTCTELGFNCCVSGQCVNHGEIKPGVSTTSTEYLEAISAVLTRPELIKNYENVFYVCQEFVPTDVDNTGGDDDFDPDQNAADLFEELSDLYNCLNPVQDEISICRRDFEDASMSMSSSAAQFRPLNDDINFQNINSSMRTNNITKISYGGKILYRDDINTASVELSLDPSFGSISTGNDSLGTSQLALLQLDKPNDAKNDIMSVYYKIDGSCEKLGSSLARCYKIYNQGQTNNTGEPARSSDHASGDQIFKLPLYFDSGFNVIVEVGGSAIPSGTETWNISGSAIAFNASTYPIFDNQEVKITYFVSGTNVAKLTQTRDAAQDKIDAYCACDPQEDPCNITPVTTDINGESVITSYACLYPEPESPEIPLQQTVYVSAKSVPHKFYDEFGVNYDLGSVTSTSNQEGTVFKYTDGNRLKPNNLSQYIGFNEIYGSMNEAADSPLPPTVVTVEKGSIYDLFVDSGAFSTCLNCGTDYFSSLQKVFPNNFDLMGGGYRPDFVESRRQTNQGKFPADDFRFGRACFLPATMIPWTHSSNSDVTTQRKNRLSAQHFMFANGYNKDWYGFDYGSLIGSFDGVKWFSIGNQRKIKAESNKLYIAVNAYFGDLTINNTFKVTVNEEVSVINSGSLVSSDFESDGAECQKFHVCESDNDCITQLGYDYKCSNINSIVTPWPQFDSNGNELSGSLARSLVSLIGGTQGESMRCVYRGQGAACAPDAFNPGSDNLYATNTSSNLYQCSTNTMCAPLSDAKFNTKIARFAESPKSQNIQSFVTDKTDTFGLGARNLGRPYDFYGSDSTPSSVRNILEDSKLQYMCIPDKAAVVGVTDTTLANSEFNTTRNADKILNVGRTFSSTAPDENYFAFCPATDDDGDYTNYKDLNLNDADHKRFAIRSNMSTNSMDLPSFEKLNLFNDDESPVKTIGYQKNTCLRTAGSACFSDFECSPSSFSAKKIKTLTDSVVEADITQAEREFWEEELTCGSPLDRYIDSINKNPEYDVTLHKCCRASGLDFTYYAQAHENTSATDIQTSQDNGATILIPGVNQTINSSQRYSRTHTIYDKLIEEPTRYPALEIATPQPGTPLNLDLRASIRQYNSLHLHNSRMCCSGHWVRNFADENGGGHKFLANKAQNIPISTFKPLSWNANNIPAINSFATSGIPYDPTLLTYTCTPEDHLTADCEIKNIIAGSQDETKYLDWFVKFELIGIPQVLIETNDTIFKPLATLDDGSTGEPQDDISSEKFPLENTIKGEAAIGTPGATGIVDVIFNGENYYSAASYDNFEISSNQLKKIFSEESFNCCQPTGILLPEDTADNQCCTGQAKPENFNGKDYRVCCLNDFTNMSVYTNRYVSSEGAFFEGQEISDNDIDAETGYLKPAVVLEKAKTMCCSNAAAYGTVIDDYFIPVNVDGTFNDARTRRWMYNTTLDNAPSPSTGLTRVDLYEAGVKWNNQVYCIPSELADQINGNSSNGTGGGGSGTGGSGGGSATAE